MSRGLVRVGALAHDSQFVCGGRAVPSSRQRGFKADRLGDRTPPPERAPSRQGGAGEGAPWRAPCCLNIAAVTRLLLANLNRDLFGASKHRNGTAGYGPQADHHVLSQLACASHLLTSSMFRGADFNSTRLE